MIPKVGKTIYIICVNEIVKEKVGFLGKNSFIIEDYEYKKFGAAEYRYDEFNSVWFNSLVEVKKELRELFPGCRIKEVEGYGFWEII